MAVRRGVAVGAGEPGQASRALNLALEEASLRKAGLLALDAWHCRWPGTGLLGAPTAAGEPPYTPASRPGRHSYPADGRAG